MSISILSIIKKIGCPHLSLHKGAGYWYFVYDDLQDDGIYNDKSVCVHLLNHLSLDQWVEIGKGFVKHVIESNVRYST